MSLKQLNTSLDSMEKSNTCQVKGVARFSSKLFFRVILQCDVQIGQRVRWPKDSFEDISVLVTIICQVLHTITFHLLLQLSFLLTALSMNKNLNLIAYCLQCVPHAKTTLLYSFFSFHLVLLGPIVLSACCTLILASLVTAYLSTILS